MDASREDILRMAKIHVGKVLKFSDDPARIATLTRGMASYGTLGEVMLHCAQAVRYTSRADSLELLRPHLDDVPAKLRGPVLEHGAAALHAVELFLTAAEPDGTLAIFMAAVDALGDDLYWLIVLLARAARPVMDSCGGPEHLRRVGALVETVHRRGRIVAPQVLAPITYALAAISAGDNAAAGEYFTTAATGNKVNRVLANVAGIATVLLPATARATSIVELDRDRVPDAVHTADSGPAARLALALVNRNSYGHDADALAAELNGAMAELTDEDMIEATLILARTLADQVFAPGSRSPR